jgi:hypothetical protein
MLLADGGHRYPPDEGPVDRGHHAQGSRRKRPWQAIEVINTGLRLLLVLWILGYIAVACAPMVTGDVGSGLAGLLVGGILFVPWLVVLIVLLALVWLTSSPTPNR